MSLATLGAQRLRGRFRRGMDWAFPAPQAHCTMRVGCCQASRGCGILRRYWAGGQSTSIDPRPPALPHRSHHEPEYPRDTPRPYHIPILYHGTNLASWHADCMASCLNLIQDAPHPQSLSQTSEWSSTLQPCPTMHSALIRLAMPTLAILSCPQCGPSLAYCPRLAVEPCPAEALQGTATRFLGFPLPPYPFALRTPPARLAWSVLRARSSFTPASWLGLPSRSNGTPHAWFAAIVTL